MQIASFGTGANDAVGRLDSFAHARLRLGSVPPIGLQRSVQRSYVPGTCSSGQYVIVSETFLADRDALPLVVTPAQRRSQQRKSPSTLACPQGTDERPSYNLRGGEAAPTLNRDRVASYAHSGSYPPAVVCDASFVNGLTAIRSLGRMGVPVLAVDHRPSALGFRSRYAMALRSPDPGTETGAYIDIPRELGDAIGRPTPIFPPTIPP